MKLERTGAVVGASLCRPRRPRPLEARGSEEESCLGGPDVRAGSAVGVAGRSSRLDRAAYGRTGTGPGTWYGLGGERAKNQSKWLLEVEVEGLSVGLDCVAAVCAAGSRLGAVRVSSRRLHSGVDDGSRRRRTRVSEQDCGQCVEVGILVSYLGRTNKRHGRTGRWKFGGGGEGVVGRPEDARMRVCRDAGTRRSCWRWRRQGG